MISIICPTIDGREHHYSRCHDAYLRTTPDVEWIEVRNQDTCGIAWNIGIARAQGDIIHLTADDLEPQPGWYEAAQEKVEAGFLPAPLILREDGSIDSCGWDRRLRMDGEITEYTRIPFAPREWFDLIGPMLETHYANDHYFSVRAREIGLETVIARRYLFTHYWAKEGRLDHRMAPDHAIFEQAIS